MFMPVGSLLIASTPFFFFLRPTRYKGIFGCYFSICKQKKFEFFLEIC